MLNEGLGSWSARRARTSPERVAVVHEGAALTYAALHARVLRLAWALRDLGVRTGDRVAYLGGNHPALLEALLACGTVGAVFVPLNTRLATPELDAIVRDCAPVLLVHGGDHAGPAAELHAAGAVPHLVAVPGGGQGGGQAAGKDRGRPGGGGNGSAGSGGGRGEAASAVAPTPTASAASTSAYEELIAAHEPEPLDAPVGLDDVCMIMYTSGTTGRPKGAMLTHGNITWNCVNVLLDVDITADEVTLVTAPMFHTAALNMTCLPTLLKGARVVIAPRFDPDLTFDLIESERVTWMFGVPAMFNALSSAPRWAEADLSSIRILEAGGAPVPDTTIATYQKRGLTFLQGYGMTETSPGVLFLGAADAVRKAGSAGRPSFFTDARVVRPDLTPADPHEAGEIVVRGPNVMLGYWGRGAGTPSSHTTDGWFRTGDVAVTDEDGYVRIVDRVKDMYISGGENVYPAEVENVLHEHPDVADCAVIGVPDDRWGEVGHAVVVLAERAEATADDLAEHCRHHLAGYKAPKSFAFTEALPRNASGKLLKQRLRPTL
ncbi:long-chain fatty acid--CoA ligase [Nocardiopsis sp. NRRL B-16309]|uniref:acyl-CoA synthetase n=1 Tax=Nocardiopsis sp. NRRL B-16309 TaxID=1519494 RepID=UPI0006AE5018|nr:long-chain fatty acid--CoA ligase [Nocardiopsis sp. NRRL B-16309]KOX16331.1 AMP-dependent synthetase [Nocardiopsis sp. NRRL B-16309]